MMIPPDRPGSSPPEPHNPNADADADRTERGHSEQRHPDPSRPDPYLTGLDLAGRRVVVVGGGLVAARRVVGLRAAGAAVVLVAPWVTATMEAMAAAGELVWHARPYRDGDLDRAWYALACTDDPAVNAAVGAAADRARVFCVRADHGAAGSAVTPAVGRHGEVSIGVLARRNPRRSAAVRTALVEALASGTPVIVDRTAGPDVDAAADLAAADAAAVVAAVDAADVNVDATVSDAAGGAAATAVDGIEDAPAPDPTGGGPPSRGRVALVGGGPGDPELITVRGRRLLAAADVVVTDRLGPLELLDLLGPHTQVIDAAKVPGGRAMPQEEINALLVAHARAGRFVVRLKGGDPYVFGRGFEEVLACAQAGVPVTVVPGVSSAFAVPAAADVPVTHRGVAHEVVVVSGHLAPGDPRSLVDWDALARLRGTVVLLMAVQRLDAFAAALLAGGRPPDTPVVVVQDGTMVGQRTLRATLATVGVRARAHDVRPPAIVVVGPVAGLARCRPTS